MSTGRYQYRKVENLPIIIIIKYLMLHPKLRKNNVTQYLSTQVKIACATFKFSKPSCGEMYSSGLWITEGQHHARSMVDTPGGQRMVELP